MTELRFANSFITCTPGADEPFEIILDDRYYGNQQLSAIEAKQIADFIYESLGLNERPVITVKLSDISEDQMKELSKEMNESGKNLATFTVSK